MTVETFSNWCKRNEYVLWYKQEPLYLKNGEDYSTDTLIKKWQSELSAATPPDVWYQAMMVLKEVDEYLSETTYERGKATQLNYVGAGSILHKKIKQVIEMYQAGQSGCHTAGGVEKMNKKKTPLTSHRVREMVEELLELLSKRQNEVAALRSSLSAAQEENKRMREKREWLQRYLNENKTPPESGEQTK